MTNVEFLRDSFALVHDAGDGTETIYVLRGSDGRSQRIFCTCMRGKKYASCAHSDALMREVSALRDGCGEKTPSECFTSSLIYHLLESAIRLRASVNGVKVATDACSIETAGGVRCMEFSGDAGAAQRLISRLEIGTAGGTSRGRLMRRCRGFVPTDTERALNATGQRSTRQAEEDSLWFRVAYHCWRESLHRNPGISARIDAESGDLRVRLDAGVWAVALLVPREAAFDTIRRLHARIPDSCRFTMAGGECDARFRCEFAPHDDTVALKAVAAIPEAPGGYAEVRPSLMFGRLLYIPHITTIVEIAQGGLGALALNLHSQPPMSTAAMSLTLQRNVRALSLGAAESGSVAQMDLFAQSTAETLDRIIDPPIVRAFDRMDLEPISVDEATCRVRVFYVAGDRRVAFADLCATRGESRRFLVSREAIVDMCADSVAAMPLAGAIEADGSVILPRAALVQFAGGSTSIRITGTDASARELTLLLDIRPSEPLRQLRGLRSTLRDYQTRGVEWLLFLYDNHFGGLLCDEMGLGKTHQALALICAIAEQRSGRGPTLVVCPTTVIGHWAELMHTFAPSLNCIVYHGPDREILPSLDGPRIILTSYGVLRNDTGVLAGIPFSLAVFDEAQILKNRSTGSWDAARTVTARMRLGMSGTPIENSLTDLKSLFDLVMPGYLGTDTHFTESFLSPIEETHDTRAQSRLHRLVGPFLLRRLKRDVLTELPEKIIDIRHCQLSDEQFALYDGVARNEGATLSALLRDGSAPVPVMHVWALIEKFKQVCDHPAVYLHRPAQFESHTSGKFEQCVEILQEALDSGEKVVVFSQHLDMIEVVGLHLKQLGVGFVTLTGSTRERGTLVKRFNTDDSVRVFVGSLKAGGTGIDLTAASVVIHYDRWWNAAREEQATDRVHRMGQTRGVQVIKFITTGTIEERIDAIIARKAALSDRALTTDDPESMKTFTREELLEIVAGR